MSVSEKLDQLNESVWLRLGVLSESLMDLDKALYAYENVLRYNESNVKAIHRIVTIFRTQGRHPQAIESLLRLLRIKPTNGEIWASLGHSYVYLLIFYIHEYTLLLDFI